MTKRLVTLLLIGILLITFSSCRRPREVPTSIAVEFNNHAASAYVAHAKGWFEAEGLGLLPIFQIYESGTAIAIALARGDIQIAYMGLTGAILSYARGVPITVVAGVHQYGYGLVVRPEIKDVEDLNNMTVGSLREGTVTDLLLNIIIEKYNLKNITVSRMSPSEAVIALTSGQLAAALIPEQHATVAESKGFPMLVKSQDLWPDMQGDVLVVRTKLMEENSDLVATLVEVTHRATAWINEHPVETAEIMAGQLQVAGQELYPVKEITVTTNFQITPEIISRSMQRIKYTTDINPAVVQEMIDFMVNLGYIKSEFKAADILNLRYLQ